MPPEQLNQSLPFLTRDMLSFKHGTSFGLFVQVISTTTYALDIRGMTKEGPFNFKIVPNGTGALESFTLAIPDVPISVSVSSSLLIAANATDYATIYLLVNGNRAFSLAQGIITPLDGISWPNSMELTATQQFGAFETITIPDPAAGANLNYLIPANQIWQIHDVMVFISTDATVANRTVRLQFGESGQYYLIRSSGTVITANQNVETHFIPGGTTGVVTAGALHEVALPQGFIVPGQFRIRTLVTNLQAGDTLFSIRAVIRRTFQSS
jgi:hypothetical protein